MMTRTMTKGNEYKPQRKIWNILEVQGRKGLFLKQSKLSLTSWLLHTRFRVPGNIFSPCHAFHSPLPSGLSLCFYLVQAFPDPLSQRRLPSLILHLSSFFAIVVFLHSILYNLWVFHSFVNLLYFCLPLHVAYKLRGLIWSLHISSRTRSACVICHLILVS